MNKKKFNKEDLEIAIKHSETYVDVFRYLKLCPTNYKFLKQKIQEFNLDISHFNQSRSKKGKVKRTLEELLVKDGPSVCFSHLKSKLYNSGLKERKCELCGQGEIWRDKKISLILDHIDGNRYNNELFNLRIVCPNCNASLDTHCGKNIKNIEDIKKRKEVEEKIKQEIKNDKIKFKINLLKDLDFEYGWRLKAAEKLNCTPQYAGSFVKKHLPDKWGEAYKHKN